ncbi:MAG: 5-(carboxyamino)imidazole ribonucleotide mutase, partial [Spirochaetota bacterium]
MSQVSVILGSNSDKEVFRGISTIFNEFGVSFEKRIISAHRTPEVLKEYVEKSEKNGTKVFIGVAGMAAALPGAIASYSNRPVIGVPVALNSPVMGLDSIFSILQMPPGIPVATVGANNGKNAALLAVEILAASDTMLHQKLVSYRQKQKQKVKNSDQQFT